MANIRAILKEIHRRSLWQILAFYVFVSVVVYEVSSAIVERRALPDGFMMLALILLIIGFPIVMITAAVQEGIPRIGRSDPTLRVESGENPGAAVRARGVRRVFTWRNAILGGVVAFTLWALVAAGWIVWADQLVDAGRPASPPAESGR